MMIKKITEKEYNVRTLKYVMMVVLGSVFFILAILSVVEKVNGEPIISFEGSDMLILGIFGLPLAMVGIVFVSELEEQIKHPENFIYCKKCKKIIRKKDIFCFDCRMDIKRVIKNKENEKCVKDYKKFYKGKKK